MRKFLIILIFITLLVFLRLVLLRMKMKNKPPILPTNALPTGSRPVYVGEDDPSPTLVNGPLEIREIYFNDSASPQSPSLQVTIEAARAPAGNLRLFRLVAITPADLSTQMRSNATPRFGHGMLLVPDYDRERLRRAI